jgi:uncharacterized protein YndB with AHSA1/START domain
MSAKTQFYGEIRSMIHGAIGLLAALLVLPASASGEPLVTEGFINAAPAEVWRLFTTAEGYKATGVAHAEVDLRIGGEIRSHYDPKGRIGDAETIVNEILAYEPERMLSIRVRQAPASLPNRAALAGTWTVLYFNPAGENMTQVRIVGLGYDDSPESQAMRKFFADGNRWTLDHIAKQYWPKCARCKAEESAD